MTKPAPVRIIAARRITAVVATLFAVIAAMLAMAPAASATDAPLEVVLTAVPANTTCPTFAAGTQGLGTPIRAEWGHTIRLCASVVNNGAYLIAHPVVTIAANNRIYTFLTDDLVTSEVIWPSEEATVHLDVVVNVYTPRTAVAYVTGETLDGYPIVPDDDVAGITAVAPSWLFAPLPWTWTWNFPW
jgi:hypothetical protein